jgi:hypothetical protein
MCLVIGKFRLHYCFTFLTVLLYGAALDGWVRIFDLFPEPVCRCGSPFM